MQMQDISFGQERGMFSTDYTHTTESARQSQNASMSADAHIAKRRLNELQQKHPY